MIKHCIAATLLCCASLYAQQTSPAAPNQDSWKPLQFLIGTWEARTQSGSAQAAGSGTYSFQPELRNHILARHSSSTECKGPAAFDCDHGDLLYVYPTAQGYKAIYFDNEGHVIHYDVTIPHPGTALFLSEPSQSGPRYRLVYELKGSVMVGKFQILLPGQQDFKSYLEWSGERQ
jgi:hypothetical protein